MHELKRNALLFLCASFSDEMTNEAEGWKANLPRFLKSNGFF